MNRRSSRSVFAFDGPVQAHQERRATPMTVDAVEQLAIGLVRMPRGTPRGDRTWARALVVRHARDTRLQLVDIVELDDDPDRARAALSRLGDLAALWRVTVLLTDGLDPAEARGLALDLGLEHQAVSEQQRPSWVE